MNMQNKCLEKVEIERKNIEREEWGMKRIILVLLVLVCMAGTANADYWQLDATTQPWVSSWSDFSIIFNDADNDTYVTVDDIYWFSGVTLNGNFYSEVRGIPTMTENGMNLLENFGDNWNFKIPGGYDSSGGQGTWTYNVYITEAPTPIPGAAWLLGTGLTGLLGLRKRLFA